jgi:hypothetical protein
MQTTRKTRPVLSEDVRRALETLHREGAIQAIGSSGGVACATLKLGKGTYGELQEITSEEPPPEEVWECELPYPMGGHEREPIGVEKIRELAFPVLVCRFEGVSLADAERRRNEINGELAPYDWPKLGELYLVERKEAIV